MVNTSDPLFWILVIIAVTFVAMAVAVVMVAVAVFRVVGTVQRLERRVEPLIDKVNDLSGQGKLIAAQGREIAEQFTLVSGHLSAATQHLSESAGLIKEEVREIKQLVGETAIVARDKVALVNRTIDQTHAHVSSTTLFVHDRIMEPARELAAILSGVRAGLEVLLAPAPRPPEQAYGDEEMFIG
jgi:methyl-accepting chemotaxis protein